MVEPHNEIENAGNNENKSVETEEKVKQTGKMSALAVHYKAKEE